MITSEAMAITHNPRLFLNFRKVLITVTICLISTSVFSQGKSDSLLNVLKQEISKAPVYDQQKELRILILKRKLNKGNNQHFLLQHNLYKNIIEEYKAYKYDSAFVYANKMITLARSFNKQHELIEDEILLGNIYTSTGMYKEAFELVANIDTNTISKFFNVNNMCFLFNSVNINLSNICLSHIVLFKNNCNSCSFLLFSYKISQLFDSIK